MTNEELIRALAPILAIYGDPTEKFVKAEQVAYWNAYRAVLGDIGPDRLNAAVMLLLQTYPYNSFPKPANVLDAVERLGGSGSDLALEAWGKVQYAIARYGEHNPPEGYEGRANVHRAEHKGVQWERWTFKDQTTLACVNALGWDVLCGSGDDALVSNRAQFTKLYEQLRQRRLDAEARPQLAPGPRQAQAAQLTAGLAERLAVK